MRENCEVRDQIDNRARENDSLAGQIRSRIQLQTGGRLRNLRVHFLGDRARVAGMATSYYVRQLAEQAAIRVVSADRVEFAIDVRAADLPR